MKKMLLFAGAFLACLAAFAQDPTVLYFDQPANVFEEALPLGNGHLGAMVYGRIEDELIRLNEATLWSGTGADTDPIDGRALLADVRKALLAEDWVLGHELAKGLAGFMKIETREDPYLRATIIRGTVRVVPPDFMF